MVHYMHEWFDLSQTQDWCGEFQRYSDPTPGIPEREDSVLAAFYKVFHSVCHL